MRGRRALAAFTLPTVLALTSATPDPGSSATPVADPSHAVDPPGPRKGALGLADVLVYNGDSLSPSTVAAIRGLKGVQSVETLSLAQVPIENKVITVAAVDPSTYRNFTPAASAETQAVWDRVAGGELAIRPELKKKLPLDSHGYLRLGSEKDATAVHIGAFAPQVEGAIDAVVNESWIPTLHMQRDNALLVTTGQTAPESLRKPIEKLAGHDASVQMLDAVARYGLDPDVQQTAFVAAHITTQSVPILGNVTCNKLIFPQLTAALNEVQSRGLADKIHPSEYAGCYYPRFIAGTTSLSNHSFGLALDLNVPGNQRGTVGEMDRTVV